MNYKNQYGKETTIKKGQCVFQDDSMLVIVWDYTPSHEL